MTLHQNRQLPKIKERNYFLRLDMSQKETGTRFQKSKLLKLQNLLSEEVQKLKRKTMLVH